MLAIYDVIVNLVPLASLVLSGYSLLLIAKSNIGEPGEIWISSLVLGSSLLMVPAIVVGSLVECSLTVVFWAYVCPKLGLISIALGCGRMSPVRVPGTFRALVRNASQCRLLEIVAWRTG